VYGINFKPGSGPSKEDVFMVEKEGELLGGRKRNEEEMKNVSGEEGFDDGVVCPKYDLTYDI
jgi:hypothetical protein